MSFANVMKSESQKKLTENGMVAYNTTNAGALLDLFAVIGAMRSRSEAEIEQKFAKAFSEDKLLATKMMFYAGNIRGGLGERRTFKICLNWLARNYPEIILKNINLISHFNRWDSLFALEGTRCEPALWELIRRQLFSDFHEMKKNNPISLLAKWMPSENTSSKATRNRALHAAQKLYLTPRNYRRIISALRRYVDVVERKMSANEWNEIDYETVPSYAMKNYRNAFRKHDNVRMANYEAALNKGEAKVNASVLYPYDLVREYFQKGTNYHSTSLDPIIENQWKSLPDYIEGENNVVVMADVSGSMMSPEGRPMATSIALAIYFAERNKGDYHNLYMTFTSTPHFLSIDEGATLAENIHKVIRTDVGFSTNLEAAFMSILSHAKKNNIKSEDMPEALVVVSDMEIDYCMREDDWDFLQEMENRFRQFGYELPRIILWNVEARNDTYLSQNPKVAYVSGSSPSSFRSFLGAVNGETGYDIMLNTLNDKMYECVTI